jgi:hypothetical protein
METSVLNNKIITAEVGYFGAAQAAKSTSVLDMSDCDNALCIVHIGTGLANGTIKIEAFGGDTAGTATTKYAGELVYTEPAANPVSDFLVCLEVKNPSKRYIKFTVTPGVANAVLCGAEVIRTPRNLPAVQLAATTGVMASSVVISPAAV